MPRMDTIGRENMFPGSRRRARERYGEGLMQIDTGVGGNRVGGKVMQTASEISDILEKNKSIIGIGEDFRSR